MNANQSTIDVAGADAAAEENEAGPKAGAQRINMATPERWISAAIGGGLLYYGIRKRSWTGTLMAAAGAKLVLRGVSGTSLIYRLFGISTAGKSQAGRAEGIRAETSVAVNRSPDEVYRFWRNLENLPRVMPHLKTVRVIDGQRSHWVAKVPAGIEIEWDAEISEDRENAKIAWRSAEGSMIRSDGAVFFEPMGDGNATLLRVVLEYGLPGGKAGKAFGRLFGKYPDRIVDEDLRRFKSIIETGEPALGRSGR
jgi:uncharacterized membrane protein